mmetsp:Transcript_18531/g.44415  ORF Transcript_18531/g.44415 Transcript_18531/m.44415 type:complete len:217 (-) Transcript_18531:959-1609(-)
MMTWASLWMLFLAMVVSCTDCISQSLLDSFITMRLLYITMTGVTSMDSTMLASTGLTQRSAIRCCCSPSVSSTKPNSPACARNRPVRSAVPVGERNSRASPAISAALASTGSAVSRITSHQLSTSGCQSSFMPMVMKNRPSSTSWKGRMSVSTWCLYSVSAISMPATKAPSARLRPACSVSQARPSVTSSRLSMKSSSLLRRATSVSHQRISFWPP